MPNFNTLILDFQNTLYDEILEYGPAFEAALSVWPDQNRDVLYAEMSAAFAMLDSDWDMRVWDHCASLKKLDNFEALKEKAILAYKQTAQEKTAAYLYDGVIETLGDLKARGKRIIMVTESTAHAAAERLFWTGLDKFIDIVYAWPGGDQKILPLDCELQFFPSHAVYKHYKKPHARILAQVIADHLNETVDALFRFEKNKDWVIEEIPVKHPMQDALCTRLTVKEGRFKAATENFIDGCLYVGDSLFKDMLMARNSGINFAHAAYGKTIPSGLEKTYQNSKDLLYKISGWDKDIIKLTHDAQNSPAIAKQKPQLVLNSFRELWT